MLKPSRCKPRGMTLVEVLIVISIITLLLQISIPAVQMAREAARSTQCKNNLRQIGVAAQAHLSAFNRFPTGGWSSAWIGDPDRGNDVKQPGGWMYNLLPYLEESAIHDIGRGLKDSKKLDAGAAMQSSLVPTFVCPSRRKASLYPNAKRWKVLNSNDAEKHGRSDYAANGGDVFDLPAILIKTLLTYDDVDSSDSPELSMKDCTGISYMRSMVRPSDVRDGFAKTYFAGEKYLNKANYKNGGDDGDDSSLYQGHDFDTIRWTAKSIDFSRLRYRIVVADNQPKRDGSESSLTQFGSPHLSGFNAVFCDGSVTTINYEIDPEVHRQLGNRADAK